MSSTTQLASAWKENRSFYALFAVYLGALFAGESGMLASVCAHYESGWLTWQTGWAAMGCLAALAALVGLGSRSVRTIETIFLLGAPPLLIGFALFMMPFAVPDEFTHINRVFDNRSGVCPLTVPEQLRDAEAWIGPYSGLQACFDIPFDYSLTRETENCAAAYSSINYLLPSLATLIGVPLGINAYVLIFAARLINAMLYLFAGYWMLCKMPFGKKLAFVFLLNPMLLQQEASCSADALCNIAALCFIVQVLAMRFGQCDPLPKREWVVLLGLALLVALCKYAYLPLICAAVILYPRIESRKIRWVLPFAAALFMVLAAVFVYMIGYSAMLERVLSSFSFDAFFGSLGATIAQEGGTILWQFAGGNLGWPYMNGADATVTVRVPFAWVVYLAVLLVAFLASFGERKDLFRPWERVVLIAFGAIESLLLFLALWEALAGPTAVTWMQGRYFIPPVFLVLCALVLREKTPAARLPNLFFGIAMVLVNVFSLAYVIRFFM